MKKNSNPITRIIYKKGGICFLLWPLSFMVEIFRFYHFRIDAEDAGDCLDCACDCCGSSSSQKKQSTTESACDCIDCCCCCF